MIWYIYERFLKIQYHSQFVCKVWDRVSRNFRNFKLRHVSGILFKLIVFSSVLDLLPQDKCEEILRHLIFLLMERSKLTQSELLPIINVYKIWPLCLVLVFFLFQLTLAQRHLQLNFGGAPLRQSKSFSTFCTPLIKRWFSSRTYESCLLVLQLKFGDTSTPIEPRFLPLIKSLKWVTKSNIRTLRSII